MGKGKRSWPFSEFMQKGEGIHKPNVWRRRESPGRKVQWLELRRKGLASIHQLLAGFVLFFFFLSREGDFASSYLQLLTALETGQKTKAINPELS